MTPALTPLEKYQKSLEIFNRVKKELDDIRNGISELEDAFHEFNKTYKAALQVVIDNEHLVKKVTGDAEEKINSMIDRSDEQLLHIIVGAKLDSLIKEQNKKVKVTMGDSK